MVPHQAHEHFQRVDHRPQTGVGYREHLRHVRGQDLLGTCSEERVPGAVDVAELERGEVAGDEEAEQRSEEHTSELQSLMRISSAVFGLKNNSTNNIMERQRVARNTGSEYNKT